MKNIIIVGNRKLVPLKEYAKPLLKLAPQDRANIREWNKLIKQYQEKLSGLQDEFVLEGQSREEKKLLRGKIEYITQALNEALKCVRSIRKSAYARQLDIDNMV